MAAKVEHRRATVTRHFGTVDVAVSGGDAMTAARMVAIHQHFTDAEFHRDVEARRSEHGDAADQHPLPRTAVPRRKRWRTRRDDKGRAYMMRPDGALVLPVGERPPDLTTDELTRIARRRLEALSNAA